MYRQRDAYDNSTPNNTRYGVKNVRKKNVLGQRESKLGANSRGHILYNKYLQTGTQTADLNRDCLPADIRESLIIPDTELEELKTMEQLSSLSMRHRQQSTFTKLRLKFGLNRADRQYKRCDVDMKLMQVSRLPPSPATHIQFKKKDQTVGIKRCSSTPNLLNSDLPSANNTTEMQFLSSTMPRKSSAKSRIYRGNLIVVNVPSWQKAQRTNREQETEKTFGTDIYRSSSEPNLLADANLTLIRISTKNGAQLSKYNTIQLPRFTSCRTINLVIHLCF